MLNYKGRQIPETLEEIIAPGHTALVVHEILNDFCADGGAFDKMGMKIDVSGILEPVAALLDEARRQEVRIIYVRYTHHADNADYSDPVIAKYWDSLQKPDRTPVVVEGTWGWENMDEVAPEEGEIVIKKYRPDAFVGTPLDELLRWNAIRTMMIVGVGAEVGIVPSVMHAHALGYFPVAVGNCIRPTDPKRLDDAMLYINDWSTVADHNAIIDIWRTGLA